MWGQFLGYVDQKGSSKKKVHDAFSKDDMVFLSGNLLVADEGLFYYLYNLYCAGS